MAESIINVLSYAYLTRAAVQREHNVVATAAAVFL